VSSHKNVAAPPVAGLTGAAVQVPWAAVLVGDGVGLAALAVGDGEGDGLGDAAAPPQVVPFSVKLAGAALLPLPLKLAPICADPCVARLPFQLALVTVTVWPDCDQFPFQPWVSVWLPV
jgi:hypothetical protein